VEAAWAELEARLVNAAVEAEAAIVARNRAQQTTQAIVAMAREQASLTEIGERCGLPLKGVVPLTTLHPAAPDDRGGAMSTLANGATSSEDALTWCRLRWLVQSAPS